MKDDRPLTDRVQDRMGAVWYLVFAVGKVGEEQIEIQLGVEVTTFKNAQRVGWVNLSVRILWFEAIQSA